MIGLRLALLQGGEMVMGHLQTHLTLLETVHSSSRAKPKGLIYLQLKLLQINGYIPSLHHSRTASQNLNILMMPEVQEKQLLTTS